MPAAGKLSKELDHLRGDFAARFDGKMPFQRLHYHDDIEVAVNENCTTVAMFGADRIELPPNYLVVFWAARPHGPIEANPSWKCFGIRLPLSWVVQWRLPPTLLRPLLAGQVFLDAPNPQYPTMDLDAMKDWCQLMQQGTEESRCLVRLEIEARLRRLALDLATRQSEPVPKPLPHSLGQIGQFERITTLLAMHFREPLTIEDIAQAVQMTPTSAMRLFRKFSEMTIHDCLVQHRVSHAKRLLVTTDAKVEDVAAESGFGSKARFYASFVKLVGQSPVAFRRLMQELG